MTFFLPLFHLFIEIPSGFLLKALSLPKAFLSICLLAGLLMSLSMTLIVLAATGQNFGDNTALDLLFEKLEATCNIVTICGISVQEDMGGRCVKSAEHLFVLITGGKGTYNTDLSHPPLFKLL